MLCIVSCACWPSVYFPWRNVYLGLLSIFQLGFWIFADELYKLCILEMEPLSIESFETVFFHSVSYFLVFFLVSFAMQMLVSLIRSPWFIFAFLSIVLGDWPEKIFVRLMSENVLTMSLLPFLLICLCAPVLCLTCLGPSVLPLSLYQYPLYFESF